ncbi:MAG: hypothetical protein J6I45_09290 [Clostridia bacterium]|nr:hypothetical protein [Clostridia bacterium]
MKNKSIMRFAALLLSLLMAASSMAACSDAGQSGSETKAPTDGTAADTSAVTDAETSTYDLLSVPDANFDNYEFRMLAWSISGYTIYEDLDSEGETGDLINDAVYRRNTRVEEDYGVTFTAEYMAHDKLNTTYQQFVRASDQDYDIVFPLPSAISTVLNANILYDMYQLPYINWDEPWWDQDSIKSLSLDGKLPMVNSDMTIMDNSGVACILFNHKLREKYQLGNLYELVQNNQWTFEKMEELCKDIKEDLNGDSKYDDNDLWGLLGSKDSNYYLLHAGGGRYADKDDSDMPMITFGDERTLNLAQDVLSITRADYFFDHHAFNGMDAMKEKMFSQDQGLFTTARMINVENLRNMDTDYGFLPMPKYETSQENYYHSVSVHKSTIMTIPKTIENPERTATVVSALAAASTETLQTAYYDYVLKEKYSRDVDSIQMLDIIFGSRVYDLGEFYSFGGLNGAYLGINTSKNDVASMYAKFEAKAQKDVEKLIENLQKNS